MKWQVLIAHAEGEEALAEQLAGPIREAGYEISHRGTVLVGESVTEEASKVLSAGGPVVLCGTVNALGTGWAHLIVNTARRHQQVRIFAVQMEQRAYMQQLSLDGKVALYWQDPAKATQELIASLKEYYPLDSDAGHVGLGPALEQRYRELALKSCDIVDLANLPENDRHIATRQLELRRLYVALRVRIEVTTDTKAGEAELEAIEKRRSAVRRSVSFRAGADGIESEDQNSRVPVGQRLAKARRLVVLGDPGAGKSTMLRWIATAYLLRLKQDPDWRDLPDVATLPDEDWLPIIVRCRDLDQSCLNGSLENILYYTLRKAELPEAEASPLQMALREKLARGKALLLLDGLDEITEPALRTRFCQQFEQIHVAYPDAPIIATSRIVGYREMGYRIGRGFEHVTVAELSKEDKDDFAHRWCAVTELPERRETATQELIHDIHSTDRIERLTGNPMLLTTMALVKRKVGKLPNRRAELYWQALQVLLNWRQEVDAPIDDREAVPQLEYIAYLMCDRGVQQLREDEILQLFERMREEYPNIHAVRTHTPEEFLRLLERRTGILVEAGHVRHNGRPVPVFEFRHLTFQEYLAGLALVDGRFPGRDRSRSLADHVAPLASRTGEMEDPRFGQREVTVTENWREALRLCVASCNDDDVDSVLLSILKPLENEDIRITGRLRAILAALCLADEPNASEDVAQRVLWEFAKQVGPNDGGGHISTGLESAAMELAASRWEETLRFCLIEEYRNRDLVTRWNVGSLCATVVAALVPQDETAVHKWMTEQVSRITSAEEVVAIGATLGIMDLAFRGRVHIVPGLVDGLLAMLERSAPAAMAASWALFWLNNEGMKEKAWRASEKELDCIISFVNNVMSDPKAVRFLIFILKRERTLRAVEPLLIWLEYQDQEVRQAAAEALGEIKDPRSVGPLITHLDHSDRELQQAAIQALSQIEDGRAVESLLARLEDQAPEVRQAASWALGNIKDERAVAPLVARLEHSDHEIRQAAIQVLGQIGDERAVESLLTRLEDRDREIQQTAAEALSEIGSPRAVEALMKRLFVEDEEVRTATLGALSRTCKDETDRKLLSRDFDDFDPFLDPQIQIDEERVRRAAKELGIEVEEVRRRYESLAQRFSLKLTWKRRY